MTFDPQPYDLAFAVLHWLVVFGSCVGIVLAVGLFASVVAYGVRGPRAVLRHIVEGFVDLVRMSPRRVWALTVLTIKESIRRKTLLVFIVFAVLFMFAGWFMPQTDIRPDLQVKNYTSFTLTAVSWLTLPVVLLLACWGLPEDIKARSLHTVVTKPVRRSEIVLGRILGFVGIATLVLAIMGTVGYFWIIRQVPQEVQKEHLVARVPVYGNLQFLDREGNPAEKGINVGDIWEFRGYIEGATRGRAIWKFDNVTPRQTGDSLRLESRFEAFRTYKGDIDQSLLVQYALVNEDKKLRVPLRPFEIHEFTQNVTDVDRQQHFYDEKAQAFRDVDLFKDLAPDGTLRIEVACLNAGQFIGMARPDLFIRMPDNTFAAGFFKSVLGIWLMMVLIVVLGVTASCFVKGPVATFLTFTLLIVGQGFREFMGELVGGKALGGGPVEAAYRIVTHMNLQTPLDEGTLTHMIKMLDSGLINGMWLMQQIIPNFSHFSRMTQYIPNGFDVSFRSALLPGIAVTVAYLIPCLLLGYFSLKLRELEAK